MAETVAEGVTARYGYICEHLYTETGNALFAWEAYRCCRKFNRPVPGWVADYLAGVAQRLGALADAAEKRTTLERSEADLSVALGMRRTGRSGRGTPFARYAVQFRDFLLAEAVEEEMRLSGIGHEKACMVVAREKDASASTVSRAYRRYGRYFGA